MTVIEKKMIILKWLLNVRLKNKAVITWWPYKYFDKRNRYVGEYKRRAIAINSAVWFKMPMIVLFC